MKQPLVLTTWLTAILLVTPAALFVAPAVSAPVAQWQSLKTIEKIEQLPKLNVKAHQYQLWQASHKSLQKQLLTDNSQAIIIDLPLPNGKFETFKLTYSPVYEQDLAKKYPNIRTFKGQSLQNPTHQGRFDITDHGFHGMFNHNGQKVFIDPLQRGNNDRYISYFRKDAINTNHHRHDKIIEKKIKKTVSRSSKQVNGSRKTYRLAVSTSGEYAQFHGGSQALALSAIVTTINRVNEIYNRDLNVQLNIINNTDVIIYTDPNSDPYGNTSDDIDVIQGIIDTNIGSPNYDIGHLFNTGDGGVAALGALCDNFQKAEGVTGSENPTGDPFDIDYVSHELGHQFGAEHIFNGTVDACINRSENSAYEPGSGTSIMGYAGICGEQNVQNNSDAYFHYHSLNQMNAVINNLGNSCGTSQSTGNTPPTVNAGQDKTIPASTPFMLAATASDSDGDNLTYTWEQYDLGPETAGVSEMIDDGSRPLFRSFMPSSNTMRYLPQMSNILAGTSTLGETMATTTRELNFVVTARDSAGNTSSDAVLINVDASTGPFSVTAPTSNDNWLGDTAQTITWNVANTDSGNVNCSAVDISLSTDSGATFSQTLATGTENDGSATITAPNVDTTTARIKISCSDNIFFAVSQSDSRITYNHDSDNDTPQIVAAETIISYEDNHISVSINQLTIEDDNHTTDEMTLSVLAGENYTVSNTTVIPAANYYGTLAINVQVNDGIADSNIFAVTAEVNAINDAPVINSASAITTDEDVTIVISRAQFDITDVDNDISELVLTLQQGQGYQTDGNRLIPAQDFSGTINASIIVSDLTDNSDPFDFTVTVNGVNDAPQLGSVANITIEEDTSTTISISNLAIEDPDSDAFTLMLLENDNINLSYGQNQSQVTITPIDDFNGEINLTINVNDGELTSNSQNFVLIVSPVNDNPQAASDSFIVNQGSQGNSLDVLANDTDIDSETLTIDSVDYSGTGTVNIEDNTLKFTPSANFSGTETLTYIVSDEHSGQSEGAVTIIVNPTTTEPPNNDDSGGEGGNFGLSSLLLLALYRLRNQKPKA